MAVKTPASGHLLCSFSCAHLLRLTFLPLALPRLDAARDLVALERFFVAFGFFICFVAVAFDACFLLADGFLLPV
ncbi:MAG: hypothetical protein WBV71_19090 [Roseobacter sp.]